MELLEIAVYELVDLLPNVFLALLPFQKNLRFSRKYMGMFLALMYGLMVVSRFLALKGLVVATVFTVLWIVVYLFFYMLFIRSQLTKLLFVLLTILNYGSFVAVVFSYVAFHRFSIQKTHPYSFGATVVLGLIYAISSPFMYILMKKKVRELLEASENNNYWRFLWLVPGTFCLSYYYNLYANGGIIAFSEKGMNVWFAVFFNLGALFVTYLTLRLLEETNETLVLRQQNLQLNIQTLQYEHLTERMEEARRAKHDLRQSLMVIQSCVQRNDNQGLLEYINHYLKGLPSDSPIVYCENFAINALLVYYADKAQEQGIPFELQVEYPKDCHVENTDGVVLLGNLLENALEACMRQDTGEKFIRLSVAMVENRLVLTLDNSFSGNVVQNKKEFRSSKQDRVGIGTQSVQKIVDKYQGIVRFEAKEGEFQVSVFI